MAALGVTAAALASWAAAVGTPATGRAEAEVTATTSSTTTSTTMAPPHSGYLLTSESGAVFTFGAVAVKGSLAALHVKPEGPILSSAITNDFHGYWLVDIYGGVYAFGNAGYYGSCRQAGSGCQDLVLPVIRIVATPDDRGYWLTSLDGGVFTFGDAHYFGSAGQLDPHRPAGGANLAPLGAAVTSMTDDPAGTGYWLVADDGTVVNFGTAEAFGSLSAKVLGRAQIVAIAATPDGKGYWLTSTAGRVYPFGDAVNFGGCSRAGSACQKLNSPISSMATTPDGSGYWLFAQDGGVFAFGDAPFYGSLLSPKHGDVEPNS
jgi:hypothetical protein